MPKSREERLLDKAADKVMEEKMKEVEEKENFAELVQGYGNFPPPKEGAIIEAKIVQTSKEGILLDVGAKCEGFMSWKEYSLKKEEAPQAGEVMQVYVSHKDEMGRLLLSKKEANFRLSWAKFVQAFQEGKPIVVKVTKIVKGGLLASLGPLKAFIPASHVSLTKKRNLKKFIGKDLAVRVIELEKNSKNIVLSRKFLLLEEREKRREKTISNLERGKLVMGRVNSITKFGVFVDLGGVDGLIHPENLSWGWVKDPQEVISVGDKVKVKVLKLNKEKGKVSLGLKQTKPDPWTQVEEKYQVGSQVSGKVTHLTNFGVFVELEEGLEGLLHISDLSWRGEIRHPREILHEGQKIKVKILEVDAKKKKLALGLKQTEPDPWEQLLQKYKVGDVISGKVREITNFGVFVNLISGIDGLIHVSELDEKYISHPEKVTSMGEEIKAEIVEIDKEKKRIRLSIRRLKKERKRKKEVSPPSAEEEGVAIGDFIEEKLREKLKGTFEK